MSKQFVAILVGIVLIFGGLLFFTKKDSKTNNNSNTPAVQLSNHTFGDNKKGVTLIEYGDFQCPACYQYEPLMKQLRDKYKTDITFQFRNFPLVEIHKNALIAARAAEAAGLQGKFWEMHDKLYENQDPTGATGWVASSNPTTFFVDFATELSLNIDKFKADLSSSYTNDVVQTDRAEAKRLGFSGTPSFVFEGKPIEAPRDLASFEKLIDDAIAAKSSTQTKQ